MAEGFDIESPDLRGLIQRVKDADPKLATGLRRSLRESGDVIIAAQRAILSGSKPGSIAKTGQRMRLIVPKNGGKPYLAARNVYETGDEKTGGVSNLRQAIADGLRTRITAGAKTQAVSIRSTGPRNDGYNMARIWQKARFRHPVFGRGWALQQGQPYFFEPIREHMPEVRARIQDIVEQTIKGIAK